MKTDTMHGGRDLTVVFNDETKREIKVRQIKVGEFNTAFPLLADEAKLVAFTTGLTEAELNEVVPEYYELLRAAVWEVNEKGFFPRAARMREQNVAAFKELPPEMQKEKIALAESTWLTQSRASPPRRG